jgi:hypothetical protein
MIHVFNLNADEEALIALANTNTKTTQHTYNMLSKPLLNNKEEFADDDWITFLTKGCISYKNRFDVLLDRAHNKPNVAVIFSDFEVYQKSTKKVEKIYLEPYNIRVWGDKPAIPLEALFSVKALRDTKLLPPENPSFWKELISKYIFLHCPESLHMMRI